MPHYWIDSEFDLITEIVDLMLGAGWERFGEAKTCNHVLFKLIDGLYFMVSVALAGDEVRAKVVDVSLTPPSFDNDD